MGVGCAWIRWVMNSWHAVSVWLQKQICDPSQIKSRIKQQRRRGGVRFTLQPCSASFFPSSLVAIDYNTGIVSALIAQSCVPPTDNEQPVFRINAQLWINGFHQHHRWAQTARRFPRELFRFVAAFWFWFHSVTRAVCVCVCVRGASSGPGKRNIRQHIR